MVQEPTIEEITLVNEVQNILKRKFKFKSESEYTIEELENICNLAGYGPDELSSYNLPEGEGPFIFYKNGDRSLISLEDYIDKLIKEGKVTSYFNLSKIEKEYKMYERVHNENLDPSLMYKRCIFDNIEKPKPIQQVDTKPKTKTRAEKRLMGREFKKRC